MDKSLVLFVLFLFFMHSDAQPRYCAPELCPPNEQHIACENQKREFAPECILPRQIVNITSFKNLIIYNHNMYRHRVASGSLKRFITAERMATMLWDDELAYLATLNAMQCQMEHDDCRNTWQFKYSGQNLARRFSKPNIYAPRDVIVSSIESWFNEYLLTDMNDMRSYQATSRMIGHFTVMVQDKNNRVGCAMVRHSPRGGVEYFLSCNYASINAINMPVYKEGPVASKCVTGTNHVFASLCKSFEPIDVNRWF